MDEDERYVNGVSRPPGWLTFYRVDRKERSIVLVGIPITEKPSHEETAFGERDDERVRTPVTSDR